MSTGAIGIVKQNVEPEPFQDSAQMRPPWS
jgi:hypothetical protein